MMACICFVCSHTVHAETNEKTREKYREVIGMNLSRDSQLCYMCSHVVHKLYLFKETCLTRILEHPAVLSKKYPMKLQKSDLEIHILCPEKCDQFKQIHNNNTYQFNYSDDSNDYNDTEYVNNDIEYSNNDTEYRNYDVNNDIEYINNDSQYIDSDKLVQLECDKIHSHNDQHNVIEQFNYQDYVSNSNTNCVIVQSESNIYTEDFNNEKNIYGKSIDYDLKNDNDMIDSNTHRETVINDTQMNVIYDVKMEIDNENLPERDLQNVNFENSNQIDENLPETDLQNVNFENSNRIDNTKSNNENPREETSKRSKKKSDKSFKRIILSVEKQKAELEANRKDKKYVEAEFKCFYCALSFLFKDTYQAHMMRHEESNGEYQCATCTLRFASPALLRIHAACHSERYLCRACGSCLKPRARSRHSCYQYKEPQSVACHLCGNLLKDANGLQQHLKRVHASTASGRRYACNVCGDSYTRQGALRTHMIKHINRKFPCDQCAGTYSSPYTLAQHKRRHRGDAGSAAHCCVTCGARYDTRKSLLAHVRNTSNHSTTTYECPICGRVCPNQKSLASHIQSVHSATKDYACSMCPARYTNRKSLVRHVAAHTKQKPVRIVICHLCGTNFKDNSKLNRHLREVCKKAKEEQLLDMYD